MSSKRPTTEWGRLLRENRQPLSKKELHELVRFLARRAAEEDYESLLMRQRRKKQKKSPKQGPDKTRQ